MKSSLCILLGLCLLTIHIDAQFLGNQDKKMIQNNLAQMGLLKTYSDYLNKGIDITYNGLSLTNTIKNGEFGLHSLYYSSLLQVNSNIKKFPIAEQTRDIYVKMGILYTSVLVKMAATQLLLPKEKQQLKTLLTNLINAAEKDITELNNLLSDGIYQLSDDQRIQKIEVTHSRIVEKYSTLYTIKKQVDILITGRQAQKTSTNKLKQLYGIP